MRPKTASRVEGRFEAGLGLAVVDSRAVQDQHGLTVTVLDKVDRDVVDLALHAGTVVIGADNATVRRRRR